MHRSEGMKTTNGQGRKAHVFTMDVGSPALFREWKVMFLAEAKTTKVLAHRDTAASFAFSQPTRGETEEVRAKRVAARDTLGSLLLQSTGGRALEIVLSELESSTTDSTGMWDGLAAYRRLEAEATRVSSGKQDFLRRTFNRVTFSGDFRNIHLLLMTLDDLRRQLRDAGITKSPDEMSAKLLETLSENNYYREYIKQLRREGLLYDQMKERLLDPGRPESSEGISSTPKPYPTRRAEGVIYGGDSGQSEIDRRIRRHRHDAGLYAR
eukprot:scaffold2144_cov215-Pinguiococcus_pyrenoidosus.AAC.13